MDLREIFCNMKTIPEKEYDYISFKRQDWPTVFLNLVDISVHDALELINQASTQCVFHPEEKSLGQPHHGSPPSPARPSPPLQPCHPGRSKDTVT